MRPKPPSNPGRRKFLITATSVLGAGAVVGVSIPFDSEWLEFRLEFQIPLIVSGWSSKSLS